MSTPSETMRTATIQGASPLGEPGDLAPRPSGSSEVATVAVTPSRSLQDAGDAAGVVLVDGDDQPGRARVAPAQVGQLGVGLRQHRGQPLALDVQGGAQPLVGQLAGQPVVEGGAVVVAVGRGPLHHALDAREIHRTHHARLAQGLAVAVLVVGVGQVAVVAHERDDVLVRAEGRARQAQPADRRFEGEAHAVAPRSALAGVVDLVEHDQRARAPAPATRRGWPPPAGR